MALSSDDKLGPYEIRGLIGAGGMGEVHLARDPRLGRNVAISHQLSAISIGVISVTFSRFAEKLRIKNLSACV